MAQATATDGKALVRRYFSEVLAGDEAAADELLAADVAFYGPSYWGEVLQGRDGFKGFVRYLRSAFPDIRFAIGEEVAEGDRVAGSFRFTATHRGEWQGLAPTGRRIDLPGCDLFRLRDGRIAEIRVFYDTLGLMQQLGAAPGPEAAG